MRPQAWIGATDVIAAAGAVLAGALTICAALVAPTQVHASGAAPLAVTPLALAPLAVTPEAALSTTATITPSLSPNRPGAKGSLTLAIRYSGGAQGVPLPVHRTVLSMPAGLTLDVPSLRSCSAARLQARGPAGCPRQSLVGRGHALAEALAGTEEVISEEVALWAFIGPPRGNNPTLELVGEGTEPVPAQVVISGTVAPGHAPYGEQLIFPFPPIPSLPGVSETALANLTLTIGAHGPRAARSANTVLVPPRCPAGGYPFAAAFTYADGSSGSTAARVPCPAKTKSRFITTTRRAAGVRPHPVEGGPRPSGPRAVSARTVSLHETGNLRLTTKHGFTLNEQGSATGTFGGTIRVRLTIVSTNRVQAEVSISRAGGSISGLASASYRRRGGSASFSGSLSIDGGTGSYSHAHGSNLSFGGTIQNSNDAIAVHLSGPISD